MKSRTVRGVIRTSRLLSIKRSASTNVLMIRYSVSVTVWLARVAKLSISGASAPVELEMILSVHLGDSMLAWVNDASVEFGMVAESMAAHTPSSGRRTLYCTSTEDPLGSAL